MVHRRSSLVARANQMRRQPAPHRKESACGPSELGDRAVARETPAIRRFAASPDERSRENAAQGTCADGSLHAQLFRKSTDGLAATARAGEHGSSADHPEHPGPSRAKRP